MRDFTARLELALSGFLAERRAHATAIDGRLERLLDELESALDAGGKRLRPQLAAWGYRAGCREVDYAMVSAASARELLHTFARIQDDACYQSSTRPGRP